ncbi:MAG: hypothetical protein K2Y28_01010 [Burkholderiaceae bacterium]|nr:hypothetical protein [Burkholderiaceae bacterium]
MDFADIKKISEGFSGIKSTFLKVEQFCLGSLFLRVLWTVIVSGSLMYATLAHILFVRGPGYDEEIGEWKEKLELRTYVNDLSLTLSKISLCKASKHEDQNLRDFYCQDATNSYEKTNPSSIKNRVTTVVKMNAFGTMELDIADKIRRAEQAGLPKPKLPLYVAFWKPFTDWQLAFLCFLLILPVAYFYLKRLHRLKNNQQSKAEIRA